MTDRRFLAAAALVVVGALVGAGCFVVGLAPWVCGVVATAVGGVAAYVALWRGVERPDGGMWIQRRK